MLKIISSLLFFLILCYSPAGLTKKLSTQDINLAYYRSYNYEKYANITDAIKSIQLIYKQYPKAYQINVRLAYLYELNRQYANAKMHYHKAIQALPYALSPKLGLLYVYNLSNDFKEASKLGYQVISMDYYNYYGNLRLAYALKKNKKWALAETLLVKMLILYPSDTLYLSELGEIKFLQKKYRRAKTIMQSVLVLEPENILAKTTLLAMEH